jgi:hypothetical protein
MREYVVRPEIRFLRHRFAQPIRRGFHSRRFIFDYPLASIHLPREGKKLKEGVWGNLRSWFPQVLSRRLGRRLRPPDLSGFQHGQHHPGQVVSDRHDRDLLALGIALL